MKLAQSIAWALPAGLAVCLLFPLGGKGTAKADEELSEVKPFETLSEAKPAMKEVRAVLAEAKPRYALDKAKNAESPDFIDLVFVGSDKPVLLRLHIRNNARPYSAAWEDYMGKLYAYLDKNGDGTLDKAEAERAPTIQFLRFHLQGALGLDYQSLSGQMAQLDSNKDGKVSREEFSAFYRRGGMSPLQLSFNSNRASTDAVTNTLYKRLDKNKDGKLSAEEVAPMQTALRRLDLDENELLTAAELMPGGENPDVYFLARAYGGSDALNAEGGFLEARADNLEGVTRQLLTHYDKDKSGKLSRSESGLEKSLFDVLDANRDDQLDAKEFAGFFRRDADLELIGRMGKMQEKEGVVVDLLRKTGLSAMQPIRVEVFNPTNRAMPLQTKVKRSNPSTLDFTLGDAKINLAVPDQQFQQRRFPKEFYQQQFREADAAKKGVVDRKQAMTAQFLGQIFDLADRDGDGKLTQKELNTYLEMQSEGAGSQLQATITDEGRSLFEVLDENGDGTLSIREMRTSWTRMKPLAKSGNGLARQDIARRLEVSLGTSQRFVGRVATRITSTRTVRMGGPLWFQKMDRNGDGDISPREFLGTDEDFRKIDADGDGLISSAEAGRFAERLEKEKAKKP
jgi:Ca2+-binding EF-hand superfamily protein